MERADLCAQVIVLLPPAIRRRHMLIHMPVHMTDGWAAPHHLHTEDRAVCMCGCCDRDTLRHY